MELQNLQFSEGKEGAIPSRCTFALDIHEALFLALLLGAISDNKLVELVGPPADRFAEPSDEMYESLVGDIFNRYWPDGVEGAVRELL